MMVRVDVDVFASEQWRKVLRDKRRPGMLSRRHLEVCVFSHLAAELRSGDIAVAGSDSYANLHAQLMSWEAGAGIGSARPWSSNVTASRLRAASCSICRAAQRCGRPVRHAGSIEQAELAEAAKPVHPLRCTLPRDAHLGGDMSDRAGPAAVHEPVAALDGERGITVRHGGSFGLWLMCELALHILPPKEPGLAGNRD